jgi:hypothetical protein
MLTLDGKNLLTHKELFYKRFIKKRLIQTNTIKNRWFKLEAELIDNISINRKIKNDIFEKIKTTYSSNLKGEDLIPIAADPLAKKFVWTIKNVMLEQKVLYGKVVGMEGSLVNIAHYIVLSEPEDFNIVFNKCMGLIIR